MTGDEEAALANLTHLSEVLMKDQPKLDVLFKNLIAISCAESQLTEEITTIHVALLIVRLFLGKLQSYELVEVAQWGLLNEQKEEQTASDRIDQISRYKVVRLIWLKLKNQGMKISKAFGALFLIWTNCWNDLKEQCLTSRPESISEEKILKFLDIFESGLTIMYGQATGEKNGENPTAEDIRSIRISANVDLLFSNNFSQALAERKAKRSALIESDGDS